MKVIGITGGIGSGKTTTCEIFQELGVSVYYADLRARELMTSNVELKNKIVEAFGSQAYEGGRLNRPYLAHQVFNSKEKLSVLNGLVHPAVGTDFDNWLEEHKEESYVLKEAAILFESGAYQDVDITVLVIAPESLRLERVMARDGSSKDDVLKRMKNQWTQERKVKLADHIITNDGTHLLIPQVLELHKRFSEK
ncbi:MAG: dephospho-CoA kinase [Flavobacteriales bacterium]|nr:dephospho-CoA kinase [Flavobacteriales bacterium]